MILALVAREPTPTTLSLAAVGIPGVDIVPMTPVEALRRLRVGDAALGRLDVRPTLDGVDDGLWALGVLAARGVTVRNDASALLAAHDKLLTARLLRRAGLPHPVTRAVRGDRVWPTLAPPVVVKPRHGSWGRSVTLCETPEDLAAELLRIRERALVRRARRARPGARSARRSRPAARRCRATVWSDVSAASPPKASGGRTSRSAPGGSRRARRRGDQLALAAANEVAATLVGVDLLPDRRRIHDPRSERRGRVHP